MRIIQKIFYKKKYIIRHEILTILQKRQDLVYSKTHPMEQLYDLEFTLHIDEILEKIKFSKEEIISELEVLVDKKQLGLIIEEFERCYLIEKAGSITYYDKYYLEEGKRTLISNIKDTITVVLFVITLLTFIFNMIQIKTNTKDLEIIKVRLDSTEKRIKVKN